VPFLHDIRAAVIKDRQLRRRQKGPECNNAIKDRGARWQLCLRKEGTSSRIFRNAVELEIGKRIVGSSAGLWEVTGHSRGVGPSEMKEETSKAQPSETRKWQYACRLFWKNSLKEEAVRHVDPLLGNNRETSNYTTAIAK
jgi:hypothetical protein